MWWISARRAWLNTARAVDRCVGDAGGRRRRSARNGVGIVGAGASAAWRSSSNIANSVESWPDHARPIEEASTLPASWYTSEAVAALERSRVFGAASAWQLVAHETQLPTPNSYLTGSVAPWRYVVTRAFDEGAEKRRSRRQVEEKEEEEEGWESPPPPQLRAFSNVCCHHAAPVAVGSGVAEAGVLTCGYHGWQYRVDDGRLAKAPRLRGIKNFRAADYGLTPIRLQQLGPLVFLNVGGGGDSGGGGGGGGGDGGGGGGGGGNVEAWLGEYMLFVCLDVFFFLRARRP